MKVASAVQLYFSTQMLRNTLETAAYSITWVPLQCPPELDTGCRWKRERVMKSYWDLVIMAATTPSLTRLTHTISFHPHFSVGLCSWKPAICVCQMCYFPVQTYKHPPQTRAAAQKALKVHSHLPCFFRNRLNC